MDGLAPGWANRKASALAQKWRIWQSERRAAEFVAAIPEGTSS